MLSFSLGAYIQPSFAFIAPTTDELRQVLDPSVNSWDSHDQVIDLFTKFDFIRLDERDDSIFYDSPR